MLEIPFLCFLRSCDCSSDPFFVAADPIQFSRGLRFPASLLEVKQTQATGMYPPLARSSSTKRIPVVPASPRELNYRLFV